MKGSGNITPLFVYGFAFSSQIWQSQIEELSNNFQVLAVGLRGHSKSGKPDSNYTYSEFADDLEYVLESNGVMEAINVGWSMGSFVARKFLEIYPKRVRALVLVGARVNSGLDLAKISEEVRRLGYFGQLRESTRKRLTADADEQMVERLFQIRLSTPKIANKIRESLSNYKDIEEPQKIGIPVLIINGREDQSIKPEQGELLHKEIHGSRLEIL
ncbi:MAG: alpha/beta hydrolase [Nitrososphaerales archaeon]